MNPLNPTTMPAHTDTASTRGSIFVEDAAVLAQRRFPGEQCVLRLHAPQCAAHAKPGSFMHVTCDPTLPMRRPMSIMRASPGEGWVECLYKVVGAGSRLLASRQPGDMISSLGPIGNPFVLHPERQNVLMIGGGVGIPPMIFLAETLRADHRAPWRPLVLMGSEVPFPFATRASALPVPGVPGDATASMPRMEDWGIPSRLASLQGYAGCFKGYVTDLARGWLESLDEVSLGETEIFACGPTAMLKSVATLAREFDLTSQLSLEEFMACAVGGCYGCTVRVTTPDGPAMKRVCVDGPVFNGASVFPGA